MSHTLQVIYPADENTKFDFDYYLTKHMNVVGSAIGRLIEGTVIVKGHPGPDAVLTHHAIATILFRSVEDFGAAMKAIKPAVDDIPNFYNGNPQMVLGEQIG
jgi:uncharacterized protein (TIGR02118 family)